ncbi:MAG: D-arabinono-1,4-lactone oxidase [Myxococcota bacterium]
MASGKPVSGALVRAGKELLRTNADGRVALIEPAKAVEVLDDRERVLGTCSPQKGDETVVEIDPASLQGTALCSEPGAFPLPEGPLDVIGEAARALPFEADVMTLALDRLTCALPPIARIPGLVELGRRVLQGRELDRQRFQDELDQLAAWNAARLTFDEVPIASAGERIKAMSVGSKNAQAGQGLVGPTATAILTAAAAYAGAGNESAMARNLETVYQQLRALSHLEPLVRAAERSLAGSDASFSRMFASYAGFCPDFGHPGNFPPFPIPRIPPVPNPSVPDVRHHCPEAAEAIAEAAAAGMLRFRVTNIEPPDACPGDEVTFTIDWVGRGPGSVDVTPSVGFRGLGPEAARIATASEPLEGNQFTVTVPDGALCGPLEVSVPSLPGRRVCGINLDPTLAQQDGEVIFEGGATYVRTLTHDGGRCVSVGQRVTVEWEACNAEAIEIAIGRTRSVGEGSTEETSLETVASETSATFTIPADHASVRVTVTAIGPCGRHSRSFRVGIERPASTAISSFSPEGFENWYGNHRRPAAGVHRPTSLDELVDAVRSAERLNVKLGVTGSGWSYSDCVIARPTPLFVDIARLNSVLTHVLPEALGTFRSVLNARTINTLDGMGRRRVDLLGTDENRLRLRPEERLVHVEAGINLIDLNCFLDTSEPPRAIATLGGSNGQTIAGAINTSTHGANADMPPIPDLVRAIHLVGPGGKQWWIEPDRMRITREDAMRDLMARGVLDPCLELRYDDELFDAALVSMGTAGVVYSYVVEVVQRHVLQQETTLMPWPAVQDRIRTEVLAPGVTPPWVLEISMNPTSPRCWVTTREPSRLEVDPRPPPSTSSGISPVGAAALGSLLGVALPLLPGATLAVGGAIGAVLGGFAVYFARRSAELARIFTNPFEWWRIPEIEREIALVRDLFNAVEDIVEVIRRAADGSDAEDVERAFADAMPHLLSVMWRAGFYGIDGRVIVDTIQNLFTNLDQRPPGITRAKSYQIMTQQDDCTAPGYTPPVHTPPNQHPPLIRLIHSQELIVRADELIPFTDEVLAVAREIREAHPFILIINLRFTQATRASLGVQQHPLSGHVELWTIRDMPGNEVFFERVQSIIDDYEAIPHWGHVHRAEDLRGRYRRHREWARAINEIARAAGNPNTFRDRFAERRRLLEDL